MSKPNHIKVRLKEKSAQGFTLIELMVVVTFIGVLASIAVPAYRDYTIRTRVGESASVYYPITAETAVFYSETGSVPDRLDLLKFEARKLEEFQLAAAKNGATGLPAGLSKSEFAVLSKLVKERKIKSILLADAGESYGGLMQVFEDGVAIERDVLTANSKSALSQASTNSNTSTLQADAKLSDLPSAFAYFGAPSDMNIDQTERVRVVVSLNEINEIEKIVPNLIQKTPANIKVSNRMRAELKSADFDVVEEVSSTQAIRRDNATNWSWVITPKDDGVGELVVTLYALIEVEGRETPIVLESYEQKIVVEITNIQQGWRFLNDHWGKVIAAIGGLWVLITFFAKKGRSTEQNGASTEAIKPDTSDKQQPLLKNQQTAGESNLASTNSTPPEESG